CLSSLSHGEPSQWRPAFPSSLHSRARFCRPGEPRACLSRTQSAVAASDHWMIPIKYNFRSLVVRRVGTMMTVGGVALTVGLFVSILAMVTGLENTYVNGGEPLNLVLL